MATRRRRGREYRSRHGRATSRREVSHPRRRPLPGWTLIGGDAHERRLDRVLGDAVGGAPDLLEHTDEHAHALFFFLGVLAGAHEAPHALGIRVVGVVHRAGDLVHHLEHVGLREVAHGVQDADDLVAEASHVVGTIGLDDPVEHAQELTREGEVAGLLELVEALDGAAHRPSSGVA